MRTLPNKAVILAGGLGTRLEPITKTRHKSLVLFKNKTILEHQIEQLLKLKFSKIIVLTGHMSTQIEDYIHWKNVSKKVVFRKSNPELSTKQRMLKFQSEIGNNFLLLYCDNYVDNELLLKKIIKSNSSITFLLQKREKGNVLIKKDKTVRYFNSKRTKKHPFVELGYLKIKSTDFFDVLRKSDSLAECFSNMTLKGDSSYFKINHKYFSASTFEKYRSELRKEKIIILDRDGIINKKMKPRKYVTNLGKFKYIEDNIAILKKLSSMGYKFVIATNQPGVATGDVSIKFLTQLHQKIVLDLLKLNIDILAIYSCVHSWNDNCKCRKPKPGLLLKAMKDFQIKANSTLYVGDEEKDALASMNAGIKFVLIGSPDNFLSRTHKSFEHSLPYIKANT
jgi:histidinol-phosphate phosphatase family protein